MRGLKSTIALAVVLAGLGAYIYFVEWNKPAAGAEEKTKAFTVTADQIEEVEIKQAGGDTSRLRMETSGWQLVEPAKAPADPSELSSVTSNLSTLEVQRVVDENPGDLAQYGLNPPRVDVGFRLKGEKDFRRLHIGEKTPTGGDLYARRADEKKVFLISSFLDSTFNRTSFDLRDKSVLEFERDKADTVEIARGSNVIQFAKSGGTDWKIVKPIAARGDFGAVEALVTRLSSGQMQKLVAPEGSDLRQYGLDKPSLVATVSTGSARASLALGRKDGEATYAKDLSRPAVFTVEQSFVADLEKALPDYRRKDVFDFRSFTANRVEIHRGPETFVFEKTKDKDGKEIWRNASGQNADSAKVEDALTKLSNLRATTFESAQHASLRTPELTVTVRFDENKTETVTLARAGSDVYAARADEPGSAKLETTPFEDAVKAVEALRQP